MNGSRTTAVRWSDEYHHSTDQGRGGDAQGTAEEGQEVPKGIRDKGKDRSK